MKEAKAGNELSPLERAEDPGSSSRTTAAVCPRKDAFTINAAV